jgi:hypothetical protein
MAENSCHFLARFTFSLLVHIRVSSLAFRKRVFVDHHDGVRCACNVTFNELQTPNANRHHNEPNLCDHFHCAEAFSPPSPTLSPVNLILLVIGDRAAS